MSTVRNTTTCLLSVMILLAAGQIGVARSATTCFTGEDLLSDPDVEFPTLANRTPSLVGTSLDFPSASGGPQYQVLLRIPLVDPGVLGAASKAEVTYELTLTRRSSDFDLFTWVEAGSEGWGPHIADNSNGASVAFQAASVTPARVFPDLSTFVFLYTNAGVPSVGGQTVWSARVTLGCGEAGVSSSWNAQSGSATFLDAPDLSQGLALSLEAQDNPERIQIDQVCVTLAVLSCPGGDSDGDGVPDDQDICPGGDDNVDGDGDSIPDFCDPCPLDVENDADSDGLCESDDNCPTVPNPDQSDLDLDGEGDACDADIDGDGVPNTGDNCVFDANVDQADFDGDGAGDACDTDVDADGVIDAADACVPTALGDPVDADGCSIAQLCPCEHPVGGSKWKNHGAYVSCVAHAANAFRDAGLISDSEHGEIVSAAGQSSCGHKK